MSLLNTLLGKKQEAPFRQLSLDELTRALASRNLHLRTGLHWLHNESGIQVAGGIQVTDNHTGFMGDRHCGGIIGEMVYFSLSTFEGPQLKLYLPLGSYQPSSRGRIINRELVEHLHAIGSIRSGLDSLPETAAPKGFAFLNNYIVNVSPEGRLVCPK